MCRSEPQIAVEVMRTMASRGFKMRGSGTSSTRSCSLPYQTFAFMSLCSGSVAARQAPAARGAANQTASSRGLTVRRGDLTRFQQLLEASQILLYPGLRILAQQLRQRRG